MAGRARRSSQSVGVEQLTLSFDDPPAAGVRCRIPLVSAAESSDPVVLERPARRRSRSGKNRKGE